MIFKSIISSSFFRLLPLRETSFLFFRLYFIDYAITVLIFPTLLPLHPAPPIPQAVPLSLFTSMSHAYTFFGYSISYTLLYIPMLWCNFLFVLLNTLTSSPIPLSSGNHKNNLCIHDSVSVSVCLVCFLDSIVERYLFLPFYCS